MNMCIFIYYVFVCRFAQLFVGIGQFENAYGNQFCTLPIQQLQEHIQTYTNKNKKCNVSTEEKYNKKSTTKQIKKQHSKLKGEINCSETSVQRVVV